MDWWSYIAQQGPLVVLLAANLYAFLKGLVVTRREFDLAENRTREWQKRCDGYEVLLREALAVAKMPAAGKGSL